MPEIRVHGAVSWTQGALNEWRRSFNKGEFGTMRVSCSIAAIAALMLLAQPPVAGQDAGQGFHIRPHLNNITQDGVTIIWETREPGESAVAYGPEGTTDQTATGTADANNIHRVRITGLQPETVYSYRVQAGAETAESTFKTAPGTDRPITFAVLGDSRRWGDSWEKTAMAEHLLRWNPEFIVNNGDLVLNGHQKELWPEHFKRFESISQRMWLVTARGNHEGSQIFDPDNDWFAKYHELPGAGEPYAAFDWGNTHFVLISYEQTPGAVKFLDEHMPSVNKKYRVVAQHFPVYCSGYFSPDDNRKELGDRQMKPLADALSRYNVDLDIAGHTHIYERMFALRDGVRNDRDGCTYIVNGGDIGGNFPEAFTAVSDDRETMEQPTYTIVHMGDDRIWFRTFVWSTRDNQIAEIDYRVTWEDETLPQAELAKLDAAAGPELMKTIGELGAMMYQPAADPLLAYLDNEDAAVRAAAATAIRAIGNADVAPKLIDRLNGPEPAVRQELARAIEIAADNALAPKIAANALDGALDPKVRVALLGALQFHAPAALAAETCAKVLEDAAAPELVRQRASYVLGRVATVEDVPALVELFDKEASEYVLQRLAFTLNNVCGKRQPFDEKSAIGKSKPGERAEFIQKWLKELEEDHGPLPAALQKWAA